MASFSTVSLFHLESQITFADLRFPALSAKIFKRFYKGFQILGGKLLYIATKSKQLCSLLSPREKHKLIDFKLSPKKTRIIFCGSVQPYQLSQSIQRCDLKLRSQNTKDDTDLYIRI